MTESIQHWVVPVMSEQFSVVHTGFTRHKLSYVP